MRSGQGIFLEGFRAGLLVSWDLPEFPVSHFSVNELLANLATCPLSEILKMIFSGQPNASLP